MPDIFGKNENDYRQYARARKAGMMDSIHARLQSRGRMHDFNSLPSHYQPRSRPLNDQEANAQAVSFLTNNFQAIQAAIEEILYLDFRLDEFFPIKTDIPEGARSYSYKVVDRHGRGTFIENNGTNAQSALATLQNVPYPLEYAGILPEWTLEDLRNASFGGIALDTETIRAATEGCMDHIEIVGLSGDSSRGFLGLTNMEGPTTATAAKTIATMTADEMVAFVQTHATAVISGTQEIFGRTIKSKMALYLPIAEADRIQNTRLADDASKSVWEYASVNNMWTQYTGKPLELRVVAELAGAGSGDTNRALFGFPDEDRVWEMAMPISPRVITTMNKGFTICAPMEYKISGLNEKRSNAMRYVDGV